MSLYQIKVEISPEAADLVDDILLENGLESWSLLQDVLEKRAWVIGIFTDEDAAHDAWVALQPLLADARPRELEFRTLGDEDWRDSYKAHFKPWRFQRLHWVPVWLRDTYELPPGDAAIWLDPGLAFGTGNHETTRLCCHRLVERAAEQGVTGRVIDAGCGSGILALSAARLGFKDVVGFDNDPEAVRVSEENAALNGLTGAVRFFEGDLISGLADRQAEVVMANILGHVLMRFAPQLIAAVAPGGLLVLSGILAAERDEVRDAFVQAAPGWAVDSRTDGEWSDVALRRP